ncbi:MAG: sulfatase-like hydrolase/transferase [Ruminococcus sp.]|nr:sulfatase-like hydrolase/transferase [Ruminococcus sp.]
MTDLIKTKFKYFLEKAQKYNSIREKNSDKYKTLNIILLVLFPIFIVCMAEINQFKFVSSFAQFAACRPSVLIFNFIAAGLIFSLLLAIFRKGWLAVAIHSFVYMALSITELFKYGTNGNHLILSDMKLFKSVKSLKSFAYIKITPSLVIYCLIVIAFVALVFHFNPKLPKQKGVKRFVTAAVCSVVSICMIVVPSFYTPVYNFFKLDTTAANNAFLLNEKFDNNSFLAFLVETASESFENRIVEPDNYTEEYIEEIIDEEHIAVDNFNNGLKPNVIVVMSESYADFRVFEELGVDDSYYEGFDKACAEGKSGIAITPTYASYTVRSEFELLFGLPVRGLNTPNMPQRELADREQPAFAQYYKNWGYKTAYVHPFQSSFYNRTNIYSDFGFDQMIFHDDIDNVTDFTVPVDHFGTYVDDNTIFNQLLELVKTTDEPMYIHTTTMQNHQPYDQGEDPTDEIGNYLQWIQHTNEGLTVFLDELKKLDEPTLVFFVGDHFPSLRGETSVYNQLNITGENCSTLYEQKYFFWSNYGADFSTVPEEKFSFFYVPYIIADIIDAPHDAFIKSMDEYLDKLPVYSTDYNDGTPDNEELDVLTYDRVIGDVMSPCPIPDEVLEASKGEE